MNWIRKTYLGARDRTSAWRRCRGKPQNGDRCRGEPQHGDRHRGEPQYGDRCRGEPLHGGSSCQRLGWDSWHSRRASLCPQINFVKVSCTRRRPPIHTRRLPVFRRRASEYIVCTFSVAFHWATFKQLIPLKSVCVCVCIHNRPGKKVCLYLKERKWKSLSCVQLFATPGLHSPWNSLGQITRVSSYSLLQGIFPT